MKQNQLALAGGSLVKLNVTGSSENPQQGSIRVFKNALQYSSQEGQQWDGEVKLTDPTPLEQWLAARDTLVHLKLDDNNATPYYKNYGNLGGQATLYNGLGGTGTTRNTNTLYDETQNCVNMTVDASIRMLIDTAVLNALQTYTIALAFNIRNTSGSVDLFRPTPGSQNQDGNNLQLSAGTMNLAQCVSASAAIQNVTVSRNVWMNNIFCVAPPGVYDSTQSGQGFLSRIASTVRANTFSTYSDAKLNNRQGLVLNGAGLRPNPGVGLRGHMKHFILLRGHLTVAQANTLYGHMLTS